MGIRVAWVIYSRHACLLAHEDGREDDLCLLRAGCWLSKLALLVGNLGRRVVGFGLASVGGVRCLFKFPSLFFFFLNWLPRKNSHLLCSGPVDWHEHVKVSQGFLVLAFCCAFACRN